MKLSQDVEKVPIPGKKNLYRLYGHDGKMSKAKHWHEMFAQPCCLKFK